MSTRTGEVEWDGHRTWYRVDGELDGVDEEAPAPLVVLHGGPGACHDYLESLAALHAETGRAVVLYDQLGCGNSEHLPDAEAAFWTVDLFKLELERLLETLGIAGGYHLLGQSWGGMLGMEHAFDQPAGLLSLTIANSPASLGLWVEEANRLRAALPADVQATLLRHEADGTTDDPAYEEAMNVFYERHVCRVKPMPEEVARSFAKLAEDPTVYHTMNGPSEFHVIGSLQGWDVTDRLGAIDVPCLVISGEFDEATPAVVAPLVAGLSDVRSVVFDGTSHMPHAEAPERFRPVVAAFLAERD
jgi:L-proline amide hydrolase